MTFRCRLYIHFQVQLKPIFHLATLFARREAKTKIRQRDWLKLAGESMQFLSRVFLSLNCGARQSVGANGGSCIRYNLRRTDTI